MTLKLTCVAGQMTATMIMTGGATGVVLPQLAQDPQLIILKEGTVGRVENVELSIQCSGNIYPEAKIFVFV